MTEREVKSIEIEKIELNVDNPRLPNGISSEDQIFKHMLREERLYELIGSLATQGFFPGEPLHIVGPDESGKYVVVEGNRRASACKLLLDPNKAPVRKAVILKYSESLTEEIRNSISTVPCIIYDNEQEVLDYMGYRHITGVQTWDSLMKARYLSRLYRERAEGSTEEEKLKNIAAKIGSRYDYVRKLLSGLTIYNEINESGWLESVGIDSEKFSFSLLTTALAYENIRNFIGLDGTEEISEIEVKIKKERLNEVLRLVFVPVNPNDLSSKPVVQESRYLKQLAGVIGGGLDISTLTSSDELMEAWRKTDDAIGSLLMLLKEIKRMVKAAFSNAGEINDFQSDSESLTEIVDDIESILKKLKRVISD